MLKFLFAFLVSASFFFPVTIANAQSIFYSAFGYALGSTSTDGYRGGGGGNIIYMAPRVAERLKVDPLEVRLMSTVSLDVYTPRKTGGKSIQEIFSSVVRESEKFTLLEVILIIDQSDPSGANFWFAYIEKEKLRSLSDLASPSN